MVDRDGLKLDEAAQCIAEYMDYPWVHMPEQGRNSMRELASKVMGLASPQPAPHAMTDEYVIERMERAGFTSSNNVTNGTFIYGSVEACRALLAQPAAVEPAKPDFYISKDRRYARVIIDDLSDIPESRHGEWRACFFDTAPSPAVAEPARKAIDAQGDMTPHPACCWPWPPAATLGKAEFIRFDFINADGNEDSKVITHEEMRERYANAHKMAYQTFAQQPAASDVRDAARYQWMRLTFIDDEMAWPDDVADARTGDQLDTAIDRALQSTPAVQADEGGGKS